MQLLAVVIYIYTYIKECIQEMCVVRFISEIFVKQSIDTGFEQNGVVKANHAHVFPSPPARFTTAGGWIVHYVISNQEKSLQLKKLLIKWKLLK